MAIEYTAQQITECDYDACLDKADQIHRLPIKYAGNYEVQAKLCFYDYPSAARLEIIGIVDDYHFSCLVERHMGFTDIDRWISASKSNYARNGICLPFMGELQLAANEFIINVEELRVNLMSLSEECRGSSLETILQAVLTEADSINANCVAFGAREIANIPMSEDPHEDQ